MPVSSYNHDRTSYVVAEWAKRNTQRTVNILFIASIIFTAIALVADLLMWRKTEGLKDYSNYRLVSLVIYAFGLRLVWSIGASSLKFKDLCIDIIGYAGGNFLIIQHIFFIHTDIKNAALIQTTVIAMVITNHFIVRNIWYLSLALFVTIEIVLLYEAVYYPFSRHVLANIAIGNFVVVVLCWYMRRDWVKFLNEKYNLYSMIFPRSLALEITTSAEPLNVMNKFNLTERHCGCVVIDWRGFQKFAMANKRSPEIVNRDLEYFHECVQEIIEEAAGANYIYAHSADEAFIIIVGEDSHNESDVQNVCKILISKLINKLPKRIYKNKKFIHKWDIGFSFGNPLIGMTGPRTAKRITLSGEQGGEAKRLEEMAKACRKATGQHESYNPFICISKSASFLLDTFPFRKVDSALGVEDLDEEDIFYFHREERLFAILNPEDSYRFHFFEELVSLGILRSEISLFSSYNDFKKSEEIFDFKYIIFNFNIFNEEVEKSSFLDRGSSSDNQTKVIWVTSLSPGKDRALHERYLKSGLLTVFEYSNFRKEIASLLRREK